MTQDYQTVYINGVEYEIEPDADLCGFQHVFSATEIEYTKVDPFDLFKMKVQQTDEEYLFAERGFEIIDYEKMPFFDKDGKLINVTYRCYWARKDKYRSLEI